MDWARFWNDYRTWSATVPLSPKRDSIALYQQLKEKVQKGNVPLAIALEFEFMDHIAHENYTQASQMLPTLRDVFKLETMDEFFLRHLAITALLAGEKDQLRLIYLESLRRNVYFDPAEKRLLIELANVPQKILSRKRP